MRFAQVEHRGHARPLQALCLLTPLVGLAGFEYAFILLFFACMVLSGALLSFHLIQACRRNVAESKLLLAPFAILALVAIWAFGAEFLPTLFPFQPRFHAGRVGFAMGDVAQALFITSILAVVFYRFIRASKDEQRSAAEFEAARTVQQVLIPDEIPSIPGFTIQSVYKPAGQVGGDFFQILPVRCGSVLAVIGDVSGKGMPAAMTVSLLVGTFRTLAHYTQSPREILSAMNQRMLARSNGGFTTCLVLRADPGGKLTAANAGHIAPYLAGKELPLENGLPLGLVDGATYSETTFRFSESEQLTLVTDGVVEARDSTGALFGFDRTAALSSAPAESIAQTAQKFGQDDDITVLTLARTA